MSRLLRITLTWLLALALPIQGYAAQANLLRGSAQQAAVSVVQTGMATHQHELHMAQTQHADTATQADADCCDEHAVDGAAHGASTHSKCSACASSCGAVAIVSPGLSISVAVHASTLVATIAVAHNRLITGGIDRPPRTTLA